MREDLDSGPIYVVESLRYEKSGTLCVLLFKLCSRVINVVCFVFDMSDVLREIIILL